MTPLLRRTLLCAGLVGLVTIGLSGSAATGDPAVLFIPEFCSPATSFSEMMRNLPRRRFGDELVTLQLGNDGLVASSGRAPATAMAFAIDYRVPDGPASASRLGIRDKAGELKSAIDYIRTTTGNPRVVLVGHGMGGLVARAYVEGLAIRMDGAAIGYDADVAGVITIDAPHRGATAASLPAEWDAACASADSTNWREMTATGPGTFLDSLNRAGWPVGLRLDSIASFYADRPGPDTDGLVLRDAQDARAISDYWSANADVRVWTQPLTGRRLAGFPSLGAHSAVIRTATTSALVNSLVEEIDQTIALAGVRPLETSGLPESSHPYGNSVDRTYSYTLAGNPGSIDVRFDPLTYIEYGYDYIHVMDGAGNEIADSPFTGYELGGRTVRVNGSTVRIRLTSDDLIDDFGFRLVSVNPASGSVPTSPLPESPHPYTNNYYAGWYYTVAGSPSAINVTFDSQTKVEDGYDFVYLLDSEGNMVGDSPYTGSQLSGKTLRVQGASVQVILESDSDTTDYGVKVNSVTAVTGSSATLSTSGLSATTERTSAGVTYHTQFTLCETGGRSAVTLASIRVNLRSATRSGSSTFTAGTNLTTTTVGAGACVTYRLNITSTNATDLFTSVSFTINYSDSTGSQPSYTTPASASISPPTGGTTPSPTPTTGSKYDGTYNFVFKNPGPGGTTESKTLTSFLIIRSGVVSASDGSVHGTVDLNFGNITFTSGCPINSTTATWTGIMNQSALAGSNFGQGSYQCSPIAIGGTESQRSWQANQAR